ncbi:MULTISPECIES: glycosyltransferase [unclassified Pseudoalteromonas]|uniref:glycosyltransferase n=1 Tax=unclassified Pseudoalteromonas TaxID=194690 RepID=UPI0011089EC7|nr:MULTISPECIES: glycosyltransferase [unclassified Pseudoalteromonas]TMN77036.1 hypothetical protein CWB64_17870 [Pseudoalteromonas sp. S410]TMN87483.1 hypothetical protein CWB62_18165 [Pseudoalteromonas sp. S408]TMN94512.1 hypothetical protein CWB61_18005 [Pseudoalteromonas sp. S407]TMO01738.1 hypothetical protein CWB63_03605 [Pseudoalteromonas sp. S409]TMO10887.1 hypothetical protein CWB57_09605 [Pseudoalteromonas sp. S186]
MKVLFFQPYLANWRIEFLEFFIKKSKHEVVVYDGGFRPKNDVKSISGNKVSFPVKVLKSLSPIFRFKNQSYPFFFSPFLLFNLVRDRPDVIITEGEINFINNISIWLYCFVFRKNYVWWSLGKVRTRKKNIINKFFDPIINNQIKNAKCIMARNSYAKDYYIENGLKNATDIIVAPNSMNNYKALNELDSTIQERLYGIKGNKKVILYVGALVEDKCPSDLLEAFSLLENNSDLLLWYVGAGPELNKLKEQAALLGIFDKVNFFGKIFDGVGNYFNVSDLVVVPGLGGLVINHAMIFSCPVISRLADGTEQDLVIDDVTGYLVKGSSNKELARKIDKIFIDEKYTSFGLNASKLIASTWNIDVMYQKVNECIEYKP